MFDHLTHSQAYAGPGMDTRQWCSMGTVDKPSPGAPIVEFTKAYGPLVRVTLHPSGTPVVCRVAHAVAGNGEGQWHPFVEGDEVVVAVPEGDENAGCVILGRLNQEIDQWPHQVGGSDSTKNNFGFMRTRTPYVVETASAYLIRSAATGAFFGISEEGAVTFGGGDKSYFTIQPDFIGAQSADGSTLFQIDVGAKQFVAEANGTRLTLDGSASQLFTTGTISIGTSGNEASEHATTVEGVLTLLLATLAQIGVHNPGPLSGAGLAGLAIPVLNAALLASSITPYTPLVAALTTALQAQKTPGTTSGVAAPGLLVG